MRGPAMWSLLTPVAAQVASKLLGLELTLGIAPDGCGMLDFAEALERSWRQDQELGSTQVGPQRAELSIKLEGVRLVIGYPAASRSCWPRRYCMAADRQLFPARRSPGAAEACCSTILRRSWTTERLDGVHRRGVAGSSVQLIVTTLASGAGAVAPWNAGRADHRMGWTRAAWSSLRLEGSRGRVPRGYRVRPSGPGVRTSAEAVALQPVGNAPTDLSYCNPKHLFSHPDSSFMPKTGRMAGHPSRIQYGR